MQDQEGMRERMPPPRRPPEPSGRLFSRSVASAALTMARHLSKVSSMPHAAWIALSFCHVTASPCRGHTEQFQHQHSPASRCKGVQKQHQATPLSNKILSLAESVAALLYAVCCDRPDVMQRNFLRPVNLLAHLLEGKVQLLLGGVGDGLSDLPHHGGQHHGHVALPRLADDLEPEARQPVGQQHVQLPAPARGQGQGETWSSIAQRFEVGRVQVVAAKLRGAADS